MKNLGENIKKERKKRKASLYEVAEAAGVTAGFLSQIENGKNEPSLTTLKKIADYLNVTISRLLGEDEDVRRKLIRRDSRHVFSNLWDGLEIELLSAIDSEHIMEACIHNITSCAPASHIPYTHEGQEFMLVLEGRIELSVDDELMQLEKGDSYYLSDCTKSHFFYNTEKEGASRVLCVTNPPYFYSNKENV